jgi:hypothetical protein
MRTDLAPTFAEVLARKQLGTFPFGHSEDPARAFARFIHAFEQSSASRLMCQVRDPAHLTSIARIGVLIADSVLLTGFGGPGGQMILPGLSSKTRPPFALPPTIRGENAMVGAVTFPPEVLDPWIEDAREFIVRGRLMYLPEQVIILHDELADGRSLWKAEPATLNPQQGVWELAALADRTESMVLLNDAEADAVAGQQLHVLSYALPTLENVSLRELCAINDAEEEHLAGFRAALRAGLTSYMAPLARDADESALRRAATRLRVEVIDPEVAVLGQTLRAITQTRAMRAAGAALGAVSMTLTAFSIGGAAAALSGILANGATALFVKEVAEWRGELLAAKQKPWYLAWRLSKGSS